MAAGPDDGRQGWDVFIAYATADREQATELWERLEARGIRCFIDHKRLQPGDAWDIKLSDALDASDVIAIVVSESSTRKAFYTLEEIAIAIDASRHRNARVVPVYLGDEVKPPYGLRRVHSLRVSDGWETVEQQIAGLFARDSEGHTVEERQIWCGRVPPWSQTWQSRDELLNALDEASGASMLGEAAEAFAVAGAGGIGKTTLAAMYAHTRRDQFQLVWWVRAETDVLLAQDLAELAGEIGVASVGSIEERAGLVRAALANRKTPWLVVFDNARTAAELKPWLPTGQSGRVIITSRSTGWEQVSAPLDVPVMDTEEAAEFLVERVRATNPAATEETDRIADLVEHLQGFPLALEHAGAYVAKNASKRFGAYLERYRSGGFGADPKFATWKISFDAVEQDPLCGPLMRRLSFCAPDAVPEMILADLAESEYQLDDALDVLHEVSLVRRGEGVVDLHRVVQDAARRDASADDANGLLGALKEAFPGTRHPAQRSLCDALTPHVLAVEHHSDVTKIDGNVLCGVVDGVANHLRSTGHYVASVIVAERAVALAESFRDVNPENTMSLRSNLASSYWSAGRVPEAIALHERVLVNQVEALGDRHPDTLTSRSNLALSYWSVGRPVEAIELNEQVLADRTEALGDRHPDTLTSQSNLASSYWSVGRVPEAIALHERVLADRVEVLGDRHPDTLTSRANLASSYWSVGRTAEAIELNEQVLADRAEVLGDRHPDTLTSQSNLALSYRSVGRTAEAIELNEQVLADRAEVLGDRHPDTLTSQSNLALSYRSVGRTAEAIELNEQVLADRVEVLGDRHPDTLTSRANLARSYRSVGRTAEAIELLRAAIAQVGELDHEHAYLASWRDALDEWEHA